MRVAIFGGGMGGLAAAWELSGQGHQVTVYQRGWRLGGKGSSGRNAVDSSRIEEHGLHILMGFYDNAFNLLHGAYQEAHGLPKFPNGQPLEWDKAFTPWDECVFARLDNGAWDFFPVTFPSNPLRPWDQPRVPNAVELVRAAARTFGDLFDALATAGIVVPGVGPVLQGILNFLAGIVLQLGQKVDSGIAQSIQDLLKDTWPLVRVADKKHRTLQWIWMGICLVGGNLIGMLRDGLVAAQPDFGKLNGRDYATDWLKQHLQFLADAGCPPEQLWQSPLVTGLYDLAFSRSTTLAAGVTLNVIMRLGLYYRGHVAYKMNSGMGDVVFAPLYLALAGRGVQFRFFHRLVKLHLDPKQTRIQSIELERQVETPTGYEPLIDVAGRACWPNQPKAMLLSQTYQNHYNQQGGVPFNFEGAAVSPYQMPFPPLQFGTDFDVVVLAISPGALKDPCVELATANPSFAAMLAGMKTMRTQALQLWLKRDLSKLNAPSGMVISYRQPFNSWADMSQVLANEGWGANQVGSVSYFCDALPDGVVTDAGAPAFVAQNATTFVTGGVADLWPGFTAQDEHRRYTRVEIDASDRYVLSEAGAIQHRPDPGDSGFTNLALAGDWVRTDLNSGCLEAATLGGLGAARAIQSGKVHP